MATWLSVGAAARGDRVVTAAAPPAVEAGLRVLAEGGNAFDAAVTMALVETVCLPMKCGLAGDLVALVRAPDGALGCLLSIGPGAGALGSGAVPTETGGGSVGVPGAPAGYARLAALGRFDLPALVAPAIEAATRGVAWSEVAVRLTAEAEDLLRRHNGETVFLPEGRLPRVGETLRLPGLTRLLGDFAELGETLFHGAHGEAIRDRVREAGGFLELADLAVDPAAWRAPARLPLGGGAVLVATPAPTHGPALLNAADLVLHHRRDPVAAAREARRAMTDDAGALAVGGTSVVTAADDEGNAVVLVHSNSYPQYGSGLVVRDLDLVLNNRPGRGFDASAPVDSPRAPAPGRVPPTTRHAWAGVDGRTTTLGATPGGINQMIWNLQSVLAACDGAAPDEICRAPRWSLDTGGRLTIEADHRDAGRPDGRRVAAGSMRSAQQVLRLDATAAGAAAAADRRTGAVAGTLGTNGQGHEGTAVV
ncbi:MAG: gamma-glutamyltransferase [Azospirillaceae bacterium]